MLINFEFTCLHKPFLISNWIKFSAQKISKVIMKIHKFNGWKIYGIYRFEYFLFILISIILQYCFGDMHESRHEMTNWAKLIKFFVWNIQYDWKHHSTQLWKHNIAFISVIVNRFHGAAICMHEFLCWFTSLMICQL